MPDPAATLLLAHAGHWTLWVLYAIPLIAVLVAIPMASRREKTLPDEPDDLGPDDGKAATHDNPRDEGSETE